MPRRSRFAQIISIFALLLSCLAVARAEDLNVLRARLGHLRAQPESRSEDLAALLDQARLAIAASRDVGTSRAARIAEAAITLAERRVALLREEAEMRAGEERLQVARRRLAAAEESSRTAHETTSP